MRDWSRSMGTVSRQKGDCGMRLLAIALFMLSLAVDLAVYALGTLHVLRMR